MLIICYLLPFHLEGRKTKRSRDRERQNEKDLSLQFHFPNAHNGLGLISLKTETRNSIKPGIQPNSVLPCGWQGTNELSHHLSEREDRTLVHTIQYGRHAQKRCLYHCPKRQLFHEHFEVLNRMFKRLAPTNKNCHRNALNTLCPLPLHLLTRVFLPT